MGLIRGPAGYSEGLSRVRAQRVAAVQEMNQATVGAAAE